MIQVTMHKPWINAYNKNKSLDKPLTGERPAGIPIKYPPSGIYTNYHNINKIISFKGNISKDTLALGLKEDDKKFIEFLNRQLEDKIAKDNSKAYLEITNLKEIEENEEFEDKLFGDGKNVHRLKALYDEHSQNKEIKRLYEAGLTSYIEGRTFAGQRKLDKLRVEAAGNYDKELEERSEKQLLTLFKDRKKVLKEFGINDYIGYKSLNFNVKGLQNTAGQVLEKADHLYSAGMIDLLSELSKNDNSKWKNKNVKRSDINYNFAYRVLYGYYHLPESCFTSARSKIIAEKTFNHMGLDFSKISKPVKFNTAQDYYDFASKPHPEHRIFLDIEPNDKKPPNAFGAPIRVPDEIILVNNPQESSQLGNIIALLHESGHVFHYASVNKNLSTAEKNMGGYAVSEAYASLLGGLTGNKDWLLNIAGVSEEQANFLEKRQALKTFYILGSYKYLIDLETRLSKDDINPDNYKEFSDKIVKNSKKKIGLDFLVSYWGQFIEYMSGAEAYVTGIILEAQLEEYMRNKFGSKGNNGDDWYKNPKSGAFLKKLWRKGNLEPEELSKELGYDPLDINPLMRYLERTLGSSVSKIPENFYS